MDFEAPLHVRVARALGCSPVFEPTEDGVPLWRCLCPRPGGVPESGPWDRATYDHEQMPERPRHIGLMIGPRLEVARYDESWFALGPWIERFGIRLRRYPTNAGEASNPNELQYAWEARDDSGACSAEASTPLIAACNLIVDLAGLRMLP